MLARSGLLGDLQQHTIAQNGSILCIYGDPPAYPLRPQLQKPFGGARITPLQYQLNQATSSVRVAVEWIFRDIINYFQFLDFRKTLKIQLSAVGKMYIVSVLSRNARSFFYGSTMSHRPLKNIFNENFLTWSDFVSQILWYKRKNLKSLLHIFS